VIDNQDPVTRIEGLEASADTQCIVLRVHYGSDLAHGKRVYPKSNGAEKDGSFVAPLLAWAREAGRLD
jgi:hypothetical protein